MYTPGMRIVSGSHITGKGMISSHISNIRGPGVRFTKVFRTELSHKYILVECSVIALCLPVVSKLSRYKLVCYK